MLISKSEYNAKNIWTKLTSYSYNEDDLICKAIDYNIVDNVKKEYRYTIYEYDALGRTIGCSEINKASQPTKDEINENKLVYKYDIEDKLTEIRYPKTSGDKLTEIRYPKTSGDKLKGIKFKYNTYKWLVKIQGILNENGEEVTRDIRGYEYDIFDRVTKMSYSNSSDIKVVLEQHTYSYDKNSNIISETIINNYPSKQEERVNETRTYTYDNLNRLVTSKKTNYYRLIVYF